MKLIETASGQEINEGDTITDFRGDKWRFCYMSGKDWQKITVSPASKAGTREFNPSVFGLAIRTAGEAQ